MPIDASQVVWDDEPKAPAIDPSQVEWDDEPAPKKKASAFSDFAVGATGTTRGALNYATDSKLGDFLMSALGHPVDEATGGGWQTAGAIADPLALATGAKAAQAVPYAKVLGNGLVKGATAAAKNLGMGAGFGGAIGGVQGGEEGGKNGAIIGALMNSAIPPAARVAIGTVRWLKELISPSPARLAVDAAGDKADDVINALMTSRAQTPGATLNAGQAAADAGSAEFSALQRIVDAKDPSLAAATAAGQQGARSTAIRSVGGTPADLASATAKRAADSETAYTAAFQTPVKADAELMQMADNPFFKSAIADAQQLAAHAKIDPKQNLTQFLHYVKLSLDKQLGRTGDTALSRTEKHAVNQVQDQLVGWLGKRNPAYEAARAGHQAASKPINRMELGQELEQALTGPLGQERAGPFSGAVRKAGSDTDVTGAARIEALTPSQRKVVDGMMADLERDRTWKGLASQGRGSALERIGAPQIPSAAGFSFALSTAKNMFNRVTGGLTEGGLKQLAVMMNGDPAKLAAMMKQFTPAQRQQVQSAIERMTLPAAGGIVSATEQN